MRQTTNQQHGFTLIEILLYVAVFALMISGIGSLVVIIQDAHVKHQTISEVEENGEYITAQLRRIIQNAEDITADEVGDSLTIDTVDAGNDPTVIDMSGSALQITEGPGSAQNMHSSNVSVANFTINDLSRTDGIDSVQYSFTITHNNASGRNPYTYEQDFISTTTRYGN